MVKASNAPVHLIIRISATHSFVSNWMKSRANITESKIQTKCNYESALSQRTTKKLIINSKQKMASIPHTVLTSDKVNPAEEISKDGLYQPCDVTLVVKDGEFKAHRKALSEASPFFEKLLNSDMKESKEGVVRLEMFTESVMRNTLEFIYTGNVQILDEDDARDLVVMADYLFIQKLKTLATQILVQKLNTSNCISILRFACEYHCEELLCKTKKSILANFNVLLSTKCEDVLKMSREELAMLISSDELHVSSEEDVLNTILAWINHDKNKRKHHFPELFRYVRLVYISRDFLFSDVVTNDLVRDNEDCIELVEKAVELIDYKSFDTLRHKPRKSLETPVLVTYSRNGDYFTIVGYFPREDRWRKFDEIPVYLINWKRVFFLRDNLYIKKRVELVPYHHESWRLDVTWYNLHSKAWNSMPSVENRDLLELFVYEDEMYALFSKEKVIDSFVCNLYRPFLYKKDRIVLAKYKPDSDLWEDILSTDYLDWRSRFSIVVHDSFIYFVSGKVWSGIYQSKLVNDVDRYDLRRKQWNKLADIQVARERACGAAVNRKIFIAGTQSDMPNVIQLTCEMYSEETNEWQLIKSFNRWTSFQGLLAIDDELYVLEEDVVSRNTNTFTKLSVACYNAESNVWQLKTELKVSGEMDVHLGGSMTVFQGFLSPSQNILCKKRKKRKCSIM